MMCSSCGKHGDESEFTKGNRSKGGKVGRCKECKKKIDAEYRTKKESKALKRFELMPDMLDRVRPRVGVLLLSRIMDRHIGKASRKGFFFESNFGLKSILSELKEPYEICYPEAINEYKHILISLTSVMDVENLIYTFEKYCPKEIKPIVVVGGFGVVNIKLILKYIDVAVFGRAEGQINAILNGYSFSNVWRKKEDQSVSKRYKIRQPKYLLPGEVSVGCLYRCSFCQYSHIRKQSGKPTEYHPGEGTKNTETDWNHLEITKSGFYTSAWDGWSQETRNKVNKPITDKQIIDKLVKIGTDKKITGTVSLKIFMIVGYPHETPEAVQKDITKTAELLKSIDSKITNKIVISFLCTPFGPEPLTPMQHEPGNIDINWNELLAGKKIYYGKNLKAYITTSVSGPFALLKRIMINRAETKDYKDFLKIAFNKRFNRLPERHKIKWLKQNTDIDFNMFGEVNSTGADYLEVGGRVESSGG